jgi:hypothetical protein
LTVLAIMKSAGSMLLSVTIRRDNLKKTKTSSSGLIKSSYQSITTQINTTVTQMLYLRLELIMVTQKLHGTSIRVGNTVVTVSLLL